MTSALNTVQMGQLGIRSVLDYSTRTELRQALESQLREYDSIETQADELAAARGWELPEVDPAIRFMSNMMARARLIGREPDSKIAAMMIQGNTRGVILGQKNLHRSDHHDKTVEGLCQRLLDMEQENIRQMQGFL